MLTGDLVRATVRGDTLRPNLLNPGNRQARQIAERIFEELSRGTGRRARLGDVLTEIEDAITDLGPPKLVRGLLKVAQDRCETELVADIEPAALRAEVFARAAAEGPLALAEDDPFGRPTARTVLGAVGGQHGLDAETAAEALYADLPTERRLSTFEVPSAEWLIHRYNVALVQSMLVGSTGLKIALERPTAPKMRQLVRWIKFHQLMHSAVRTDERLEIALDGPLSLFGPSTRYGLQLARFFPALLLQPGPWRMEATVLWTRARHRKQLVITDELGLRSHFQDTGAYRTKTHDQFVAQFADRDRGWVLTDGTVPLQIGDRDLLFPDFTLQRGEVQVHLELMGYWKEEVLAERLAVLDTRGPDNLILAISRRLRGDKGTALPEHPRIVPYAEVLSVPKVLEAAETIAEQIGSNTRKPRASKRPAGGMPD